VEIRIALITDASWNLGNVLARDLAHDGYDVVITPLSARRPGGRENLITIGEPNASPAVAPSRVPELTYLTGQEVRLAPGIPLAGTTLRSVAAAIVEPAGGMDFCQRQGPVVR
jgi:NAD(P)-dependent dehydrogenase (short-subunit alcohol dehydrogenase family)